MTTHTTVHNIINRIHFNINMFSLQSFYKDECFLYNRKTQRGWYGPTTCSILYERPKKDIHLKTTFNYIETR